MATLNEGVEQLLGGGEPLLGSAEIKALRERGEISEREAQVRLALTETWGDPEPLDAELEEYMEESEELGRCIRHPLIYAMMYHPIENARLNKGLRLKRQAVRESLAERNFSTAVFLHERPYRLDAFTDFAWRMRDQEYWRLLGTLWVDSENIWQSYKLWHDALHSDRSCRWAMMDKGERDALRKLKRQHKLLVHRGYAYDKGDTGMSWTLQLKTARWFAERFANLGERCEPRVATGVVDVKDVIAHFTGRGEAEIVALPEHIQRVKVVQL